MASTVTSAAPSVHNEQAMTRRASIGARVDTTGIHITTGATIPQKTDLGELDGFSREVFRALPKRTDTVVSAGSTRPSKARTTR
ncbi:MAG: hypothetical protein U0165_07805 [Polyangiaceae bacterium]